jgi:hypothetical protein
VLLASALILAAAVPEPSQAGDPSQCAGPLSGGQPSALPPSKVGLRFGIYPGGVAGQLVLPANAKPEDPASILRRLAQLAPRGGPFVIHGFIGYSSDPAVQHTELTRAADLLRFYGGAGYELELVVRYQVNDDVAGYVRFLNALMERIGSDRHLVGLQVTNEVNFTLSADSSDGAFSGALQALVQGVVAAKSRALALGRPDLGVGFNWFYRMDPQSEARFWNGLRDAATPEFMKALDWVGLDAYPGTVFPPAALSSSVSLHDEMINALGVLRDCFMPAANLPRRVALHVSENGWPTGPGRTPDVQRDALSEMVQTVRDYSGRYGVTDYRWFDLRDADSSSPNFQQQYGITTDDYTPKPAFGAYRDLMTRYTTARGPVAPGGRSGSPRPSSSHRRARGRACLSRRVLTVHRPPGGRVRVQVDGRSVHVRIGRGDRLRISLRGRPAGRHRVRLVLASGHVLWTRHFRTCVRRPRH